MESTLRRQRDEGNAPRDDKEKKPNNVVSNSFVFQSKIWVDRLHDEAVRMLSIIHYGPAVEERQVEYLAHHGLISFPHR